MSDTRLMVTLWPSFPHFGRFAFDSRLAGIRLNSAMMEVSEIEDELKIIEALKPTVPLWFDIKGRQLRIEEVIPNENYLDLRLNHPVEVPTPTPVLFKAGEDGALLLRIEEDGKRLIFDGGPYYEVKRGESLHIRNPRLKVFGEQFTPLELDKIELVKAAGFKHYFLSYVESQTDVDEFLRLVGEDCQVHLKIENKSGLEYVRTQFKKQDNLVLVAARGDMYVEVDRPHEILAATKLVIEKDPFACVGSRLLLSVIHNPVPSAADFSELAWLYDVGYREMMLCDELCLKEELLARAVNVFDSFVESYVLGE